MKISIDLYHTNVDMATEWFKVLSEEIAEDESLNLYATDDAFNLCATMDFNKIRLSELEQDGWDHENPKYR